MIETEKLPFQTSGQAADTLGIPYDRLFRLVRNKKVQPKRLANGDYIWFPEDLNAARAALRKQRKGTPWRDSDVWK